MEYGPVAKFSESVHVAATPDDAWETASDLSRLGEWMVMHEAWRGEVPAELGEGTELTSVVSVKGLRNRVTWTITHFDPPESLSLVGEGVGGTKISLGLSVRADGTGSSVGFDVEFTGKLVFGPVGATVKRALEGEVRESVRKLSRMID